MISYKKSYAEQLLQLALALSLLQVDPESYLGHRWETQLDIRNGDAWELEMLRAVPPTEYPYANRKVMIPLIEDLVRFDRQIAVNNYHDITAYLLNVQSSQNNTTSTNDSGGITAASGNTNSQQTTGSILLEHPIASGASTTITVTTSSVTSTVTTAGNPNQTNLDDLFLNSHHFLEQVPLIEQNFADLIDYDEIPSNMGTYYGLPLKDEPSNNLNFPFDIKIENLNELRVNSGGSTSGGDDGDEHHTKPTNGSINDDNDDDYGIENLLGWTSFHNIFNDEIESQQETEIEEIKKEIKSEFLDDSVNENSTQNDKVKSEKLESTDENEIVEVLWKQDVDLGYSLSPSKSSKSPVDGSGKHLSNSNDVDEKLKALEELKFEKLKDELIKPELDDEWAGIPFTIDHETGEYIRLPSQLDDFLQDVLQLSELTADDQQETKESNESSATSVVNVKNSLNNNKNKKKERERKFTKNSDEGLASATDEDDIDFNLKSKLSLSRTSLSTSSDNTLSDNFFNSPLPSPLFDFDEANELNNEIDMMIQSAGPFHHQHHHRSAGQNYASTNSAFRQSSGFHHHHHHQSRVPLSRGVSMEQHIANLFNPISGMGVSVSDMAPYSHYPNPYYQTGPPGMQHGQFSHHSVLHNTALADLGSTQPHYGHNLGSAVSSSMHLTNSSHENDAGATALKLEHDMMYYSNTSSELNHTTDGFINSILNDEDLQLMDMGVNENFCSMRMMDANNAPVLGASGSSAINGHHHHLHHHNHHGGNHIQPVIPNHLRSGTETAVAASLGSDGMGSSGDRLDASSDSAVSSMGSERVPSLSDGEWGEGSDSAQDYHQSKYGNSEGGGGAHDYSYNNRLNDASRQPPVAQKKHQLFGKRYFQEPPLRTLPIPLPLPLPQQQQSQQQPNHPNAAQQNLDNLVTGTMKYEYDTSYPTSLHQSSAGALGGITPSINNIDGAVGPLIGKDNHIPSSHWSLDFSQPRQPRTSHDLINHNHTYTLPQGTGSTPRPTHRDKKMKKTAEDEHLTRDEKRARALNVPIPVQDIINLPMDEFNERLSKYDLTENQLSLIRDIRRRGKNKVAAQNCRKRKLDQILSLEDEVKEVRRKKEQYYADRELYLAEKNRISNKFAALHRHVFNYLRDPDGNLCSPNEYSLQQAADGSVYLLRRDTNKPVETNTNANNSNRNYDATNSSSHHYHMHAQQQQQPQQQSTQHQHNQSQQRPSPSSSTHHQKE